ncbi:MAG: S49 family peptidase, partial [Nitrospinota bacterium]
MQTISGKRERVRWGRRVLWALAAVLLAVGLTNYLLWTVGRRSSGRIALLRIEGPILSSQEVVRRVERYGRDSTIRGLVIVLNSPGGGVAASQEIYHALRRFRRGGKVVVSSMQNVAASGAYYVALTSDKIFANAG